MSGKYDEAGDTIPLSPQKGHEAPPAYSTQPATVVVAQPHVVTPGAYGAVPPNDYLVLSIFTLLCCFWPLGIFALIKSIEVRSATARGDYVGAEAASRSALQFNKVAILIGIISIVISVVIALLCQLTWIIPLAAGSYKRN